MEEENAVSEFDIAIIGMSCRFPGAATPEEFWRNIVVGRDCVSAFGVDELEPNPLWGQEDPSKMVRAYGVLEDAERFDAAFFRVADSDALWTDPQHRVFLETACAALEDAGCDPDRYSGAIALYAGTALSTYLLGVLQMVSTEAQFLRAVVLNDKDYLSTRASYLLNLRGESVGVQTGCSSSLVAVHLACQSLLSGQCDMALAGGVAIRFPQKAGYQHQNGMIFSSDGHCRAFDRRADGTVGGNGAGLVALKLLARAIEDGDCVRAVIKGSAINNDGAFKVGYTAPSVQGQIDVICKALRAADVQARDVSYVEAHGTGTPLGDQIELEALQHVFRTSTPETGFCTLGSVKANIGHLDAAAGVAGLIKTALALEHCQLPPTIHAAEPHSSIADSPFMLPTLSRPWHVSPERPVRTAAVSSFGVGGTNAHVVLTEAPVAPVLPSTRDLHLFGLSAPTPVALQHVVNRLAGHLASHPTLAPADVAFTLALGRRQFRCRRAVVAETIQELAATLVESPLSTTSEAVDDLKPILFFPSCRAVAPVDGVLSHEPKALVIADRCRVVHQRVTAGMSESALDGFSTAYALGRLWLDYGVSPAALVGCGEGMYAAACLAGLISERDSLRLATDAVWRLDKVGSGATFADLDTAERAAHRMLLDTVELRSPDLPMILASGERWTGGDDLAALRQWCFEALHSVSIRPDSWSRLGERTCVVGLASERAVSDLSATASRPAPIAALAHRRAPLAALGALWVAGTSLDWHAIYSEAGRRVPLPTYPFGGRRYWVGWSPAPARGVTDSGVGADNGDTDVRGATELTADEVAEQVRQVWRDVLKVDSVDDNQAFLELGGDSLDAVDALNLLRKRLSVTLALEDILEHQTIAKLLPIIARNRGSVAAETGHYCAFELLMAGEMVTVTLTREDYERDGSPAGAQNFRLLSRG